MPSLPRLVLTPREVAQLMGWKTVVTVYSRMKRGTLPFTPIPRPKGKGPIRFALADVEAVLGTTIDIDTLDAANSDSNLPLDLEAPDLGPTTSDPL